MLVNMSGGKKVENIINEIVAPTLLWTNSNPTTIPTNLNLQFNDDWDAYFVECRYTTLSNGANTFINYIPSDGNGYTRLVAFETKSPSSGRNDIRNILGVSRNSINVQADRQGCIPTRIWGVKYTL